MMTPSHFYTWQNWSLLGLGFSAECISLYLSLKTQLYRRLIMVSVCSGFCVAVDLVGTVIAWTAPVTAINNDLYKCPLEWNYYWLSGIASNILVMLLAIQLVTEVLKLRYLVTLWSFLVLGIFGVVAYKLIPSFGLGQALMLTTVGDVLSAVALLAVFLIPSSKWPAGFTFIVAGVVSSVLLSLVCSVGSVLLHNMILANVGMPFASLIATLLFIAGALTYAKQQTRRI